MPPLLGLRKETAPLGDCDYRTGTHRLCAMGDGDSDRMIVVVGDSHARAWSPGVQPVGGLAGYAVHNFVFSGCSASVNVQADLEPAALPDCEDFKVWVVATVADLQPEVMMVATSAVSPIVGPTARRSAWSPTARSSGRWCVGFAQETPSSSRSPSGWSCWATRPKLPREPGVCLSQGNVTLQDCLFKRGPLMHSIQMDFKSAAREQGVAFVDAAPWFCYELMCPPVIGRTIAMRDSEHMTPDYALAAEPLACELALDGLRRTNWPTRVVPIGCTQAGTTGPGKFHIWSSSRSVACDWCDWWD